MVSIKRAPEVLFLNHNWFVCFSSPSLYLFSRILRPHGHHVVVRQMTCSNNMLFILSFTKTSQLVSTAPAQTETGDRQTPTRGYHGFEERKWFFQVLDTDS